jgi:tetratricopeptide (TPR) repeat protein
MKYSLTLIIYFFINILNAQELVYKDEEICKSIKKGLDKMYNFEFTEAESIFADIKKKYPANPAYDFLMAMNCFIKMYANNTYTEKSLEYFEWLNSTIEKNTKLEIKYPNNPEVIFYYMSAYSSMTLYYAQRKETMKALGYAKKTYDYFKQGYQLKEQYHELYFSAGIYDFYREQYPETHPVYKSFMWLFSPGDKAKGIKQLKYAADNTIFTSTEAHFFIMLLNIKYESQFKDAAIHGAYLHKKYPRNLNYLARYIEALLLSENYTEAETLIVKISGSNKKIYDMAYYLFKAIILEKKDKNYDLALGYYAKAIQLAKQVEFPVNDLLGHAYWGLGRIFENKNDPKNAILYYEKAIDKSDYQFIKQEAKIALDKIKK